MTPQGTKSKFVKIYGPFSLKAKRQDLSITLKGRPLGAQRANGAFGPLIGSTPRGNACGRDEGTKPANLCAVFERTTPSESGEKNHPYPAGLGALRGPCQGGTTGQGTAVGAGAPEYASLERRGWVDCTRDRPGEMQRGAPLCPRSFGWGTPHRPSVSGLCGERSRSAATETACLHAGEGCVACGDEAEQEKYKRPPGNEACKSLRCFERLIPLGERRGASGGNWFPLEGAGF